MTKPSSSIPLTPGGGVDVASQTIPGTTKEAQTVMVAGPSGHIEGSLDTWMLAVPPQGVGASKRHFDLFNADATKIVKVRGIWVIIAQDVANTGAVSIRLDWWFTNTVGTGGTAAQGHVGLITGIGSRFTPKDQANFGTPLPAGITARAAPTGGAADAGWLFPSFHGTEELQVHAALSQWNNVLPNPERGEQEVTLRQNQGIKAVQATVVGVGNLGFLASFTVE